MSISVVVFAWPFLTIIFILVILASVASQWPRGAGSQAKKVSEFEEGVTKPDARTTLLAPTPVLCWPEDPPGRSHTTPVAAPVSCLQKGSFGLLKGTVSGTNPCFSRQRLWASRHVCGRDTRSEPGPQH